MEALQCYDVAIVGAGIQGSATAWYLAKHCGKKVILLEQFSLNHTRGSSHGETRIIRYMYPESYFVDMMTHAYPLWHELSRDSQKPILRETGGITTVKEVRPDLKTMKEAFDRRQLPYTLLSAEDIGRRFPGLQYPPGWEGLYDPHSGVLSADLARSTFQSEFAKHGGTLRPNSPVKSIRPGAEVIVVLGDGSVVRARNLIITAGAWSKNVLSELGVHLPLQVERINVFYWRATNPDLYSRQNKFPVLVHYTGATSDFYALPIDEYPGLFKFLLHHGRPIESPDCRDKGSHDNGYLAGEVATLAAAIRKHCPYLEEQPAVVETCMYTTTPDENPVIDTHPVWKNIAFGCGFSGHGFKLAPVVGQMLAQMVLGEAPIHNVTPFKADRFAKSKL